MHIYIYIYIYMEPEGHVEFRVVGKLNPQIRIPEPSLQTLAKGAGAVVGTHGLGSV